MDRGGALVEPQERGLFRPLANADVLEVLEDETAGKARELGCDFVVVDQNESGGALDAVAAGE